MANLKKFITDLTAQLQLSEMNFASRSQLSRLKASGGATKDQSTWNPNAALPNPTDLEYDLGTLEWEELYAAMLKVFHTISQEKDAKKLLDKFYGRDNGGNIKGVDTFTVHVTDISIASDIAVLLAHPDVQKLIYTGGFKENPATLITNLNSGAYLTDAKSLGQLEQIIGILWNNQTNSVNPIALGAVTTGRLQNIYAEINTPVNTTVPPEFYANYTKIFKELVKDEKARNLVISKDEGVISQPLEAGLKKTHYKDGKNIVVPYYPGKKRLFAQGVENVKNVYDDFMGKFAYKGKREQMPNNARAIFDEIYALKIKPTDGLAKVLENADKIKSGLQSKFPAAVGDFDAMIGSLKNLSSTPQFKEALHSGKQMTRLVEGLADQASGSNKDADAAKTTQFVLDGLSYGLFTSGTRDAIRKIDMDLAKGTTFGKVADGLVGDAIKLTGKSLLFAVTETANLIGRIAKSANSTFEGHKGMEQALAIIEKAPAAHDLDHYKRQADAARTAYEDAAKNGEKGAAKLLAQAEKAEILVQAKEYFDARAGVPPTNRADTTMGRKIDLMAHWNMIRGGFFKSLFLGNEKAIFNNKVGGGLTEYEQKQQLYLKSLTERLAA